jgi:hypothetical protein
MTTPISDSIPLEIMDPPEKKLALIINENQLETESASFLTTTFVPFLQRAEEWAKKAEAIQVKDATDTGTMLMARTARLELRKIRIAAEKAKDSLKAEGLRRNKAIQGAYNIVAFLTEPIEEKLQAQEDFVERQEAKRKADLKIARETALAPYGVDTSFYVLSDMPNEAFDQLLSTSKLAHEAKLQAAIKVEQERLAKEKADAEERARVQAENERLKAEALKAAQEKAEADAKAAKAKAESDARLAAEREKAAKESAEIKRKADEALATERAKAAQEAAKVKAEADRVAKEAAEKARKEREAAAEVARKAKEVADAKIKAAEDARKKAEAEAKRIKDVADAKAAEEAAAKKRAAAAPDKDKLKAFAVAIRALPLPSLTTTEGKAIATKLAEQNEKYAVWVEKQAEGL